MTDNTFKQVYSPKPRKRRKIRNARPEEILQRHAVGYLKKIEVYTGNITFFHPPNELLRDEKIRKIYGPLGVRSGVPDLVIMLKGGKTVFIELKAGKGKKATESQNDFSENLKQLGFSAYLVSAVNAVDVVNQIMDILINEGLEGVR